MKTIVHKIDQNQIDRKIIQEAGAVIASGGLVAFPTETVYGLGADALDAEASSKIYAAKGRPSDNPLIVHIADLDALERIGREVPDIAYRLAEQFWPGPLTMILKKSESVPLQTTGGLNTVAVRMPSHPVAKELIQASGTYIAAPSANRSGRPSPTKASHVLEDLDGKIDMILDSGKVGIGIESTIIDLTEEVPSILRPGYITQEKFEAVIGQTAMDPGILEENQDPNLHPKAPGMKYRHYAPKGELTIVEGNQKDVIDLINRLTQEKEKEGKNTAVIAVKETAGFYQCAHVYEIGSRQDEESIAANLYDILRKLDEDQREVIFTESYQGGQLGLAVMNRLLKAAGHHVIFAGEDCRQAK